MTNGKAYLLNDEQKMMTKLQKIKMNHTASS